VLKVNMQEFLSMTHSMDEMLAVFQKRMIADLKRGYSDYVWMEKTVWCLR